MDRQVSDHVVEGENCPLQITAIDEQGAAGPCNRYLLRLAEGRFKNLVNDPTGETFAINFQDGPIKQFGPNGVTIEALLAISADRIDAFQLGEFSCQENAEAVHHIRCALSALQRRTARRIAAGVEGTHKLDPVAEGGVAIPTAETIPVNEQVGGEPVGSDSVGGDTTEPAAEVIGNLNEPPTAPTGEPAEDEQEKGGEA